MSEGVLSPAVAGTAADVPFIAIPPSDGDRDAPVVVFWHGFDPPRAEAALAGALPLVGLHAWRIYLGLPMFGVRGPGGGWPELQQRSAGDPLLQLYGPIVTQAAAELDNALLGLHDQMGIGRGPLGLAGFAAGGAAALLATAGGRIPVQAVAVVGAVVRPTSMIAESERRTGTQYPWSGPSRELARRLDFLERSDDFVVHPMRPPIMLVNGQRDHTAATGDAIELHDTLVAKYGDPGRVAHRVVPDLGAALIPEPGLEPVPQSPAAVLADKVLADWFARHLY
jgi:hypothetical protein